MCEYGELQIGDNVYYPLRHVSGVVVELRYNSGYCDETYPMCLFDDNHNNDLQGMNPKYLTKITEEERLVYILKHKDTQ